MLLEVLMGVLKKGESCDKMNFGNTAYGTAPPCLSSFKFFKRKLLDSKSHFGSKSPYSKLDVGFQETGLNLYWFLDIP